MNEQIFHKHALYELMCRYCSAVDSRNFKHLLSIYHQSATHDHGPMFCGNPESLISFLQEAMVNMTTHHMIGNHLYHISGDTAQGEIYSTNTHIFHSESGDVEYTAGGRYVDSYRFFKGEELQDQDEQGRWLITSRKRVIDWTREGASSPSDLQFSPSDYDEVGLFLEKFV